MESGGQRGGVVSWATCSGEDWDGGLATGSGSALGPWNVELNGFHSVMGQSRPGTGSAGIGTEAGAVEDGQLFRVFSRREKGQSWGEKSG